MTVAGAEAGAGASIEREIYQNELAQSIEENASLAHTAEVAEQARLAAVAGASALRSAWQ